MKDLKIFLVIAFFLALYVCAMGQFLTYLGAQVK